VIRNQKKPTEFSFVGYSGGAVDLSDHGLDEQAVYNLETTTIKNNRIKMMYNHRTHIGHTKRVENTKKRVIGEGVFSIDNKITKRIKNAAEADFPYEMSMAGDARKVKVEFHPNGVIANGRRFTKPTYLLNHYVVDEMTITEEGRDNKTFLRLSNSKLTRSDVARIKNTAETKIKKRKKIALENARPVKTRKTVTRDEPMPKKRRLKNTASPQKISTGTLLRLNNKYGNDHGDLIARAADENWDRERLKNAIKLDRYEKGLGTGVRLSNTKAQEHDSLLEARIVKACSEDAENTVAKHYGEKIRDRVCNMPDIGLKEFMMQCAHRVGERSFTGHSDAQKLLNFLGHYNKGNLGGRINNAGSFSSFDMPNLFLRTTSIIMEEAWTLSGFFAKEMCYKTSQPDFKKTQRFRPQGGQMWEGLDQQGKIKHANFGDEVYYETELDTKAQMLMIDRTMVKNDDFGAIKEVLKLMVEGSKMVPDYKLVNRMLQAQGAFFKAYAADTETGGAGTGNDVTGGSAALTETGLALAYDLASERTTEKGSVNWLDDIADNWTIVVATKAQERAAWDIVGQKEVVNDTTANTKTKKDNYWYKRFDIKRYPQLSNLTFNSAANRTNWFLWPKDNLYAPFAINWLDGIERPTVETVDAPVDQLGFGVRGYIDVDINDRESEAIVRCRPDA
jgi:hypothetical protein